MDRKIDADRLIARIVRLSRGDMLSTWTAMGVVKVIEEEAAEPRGKIADDFSKETC